MTNTHTYSQDFKDDVVELFKQGLRPTDVYPLYKDVPKKTIRDWFNKYRISFPSSPSGGIGDKPNLIALEGRADLTLFRTAELIFRRLGNDKHQPGSVQLGAAKGLLKLIELKRDVARKILTEEDEKELEELENIDFENLPPDDKYQVYRSFLEQDD